RAQPSTSHSYSWPTTLPHLESKISLLGRPTRDEGLRHLRVPARSRQVLGPCDFLRESISPGSIRPAPASARKTAKRDEDRYKWKRSRTPCRRSWSRPSRA